MPQRGPALVRISLLCVLFAALLVALVQPTNAGTAAAPEVTDPADDVAADGDPLLPIDVPLFQADFAPIDIRSAYVNGNATHMWLVLTMDADVVNGATYNATFKVNGTSFGVERTGNTVSGPAGVAATASGASVNFTIPVASVGAVAGLNLTELKVHTAVSDGGLNLFLLAPGEQDGTDDAGPGSAFTFTAPAAGDTDGDGIPDACEKKYFGNTTAKGAANATEDQDKDGLTLVEECAKGTDPTKADSDGDGVNDKDDPFPTDPTKGGKTTTSTSGSKSSTSGSKTGSGSGSGSNSGSSSDDEVKSLGDAIEKLKSDADYLGFSAGGLVAVLILAILALAVRWSL